MGLFSRNKEAPATGSVGVSFETVRRSTRASGKRSATDTRFDGGSPLDPAKTVRTRARRRLIGAVALALAAIVFVPMLFDRAPVPPSDDIALQIPDRDTPFEGRRGVPRAGDDASRGPLKPAGDLPVVAAVPTVTEPVPGPSPEPVGDRDAELARLAGREAPASRVEKLPDAKTPEQAIEKLTEKANEKPQDKQKIASANADAADDPHAIAALEGRSEPASPAAAGAKTYAVQIAAYAAPEKARGMRDQLVAAGLKSYVESVSTAQGLRTRVRLGPFASREAADHARAKLKTMKLEGSVVPL